MKLALLQLEIALGKVEKNYHKAELMIGRAMQTEPDVIVLPELWDTGFFPTNVMALADEQGCRTKEWLRRLARQYQVNIVGGSVAVKVAGQLYNTNYVMDRRGNLRSEYQKIHLFSPAGEHEVFKHGTKVATFTIAGAIAAVVICYDLRFCELIRILALQGIAILFVVAAWPATRLVHWQTLLKARAIENQMFVVAVNGVGSANQLQLGGGSTIIDPWGEVLLEGERQEQILTGVIDMDVITTIRRQINVFQDRQAQLYTVRLCP